jgi:hypothetical protein
LSLQDDGVSRDFTFNLALHYSVSSDGLRYQLPGDSIRGQSIDLESKDDRISGKAVFLDAEDDRISIELTFDGPACDGVGGIATGPFRLEYRISGDQTLLDVLGDSVDGEAARLRLEEDRVSGE